MRTTNRTVPFTCIAVFLVAYNTGHIAVRGWAYTRGWQAGLNVGGLLKGAWLERWSNRMWPANMLLTGVVTVVLAASIVERGSATVQPVALAALGSAVALLSFRFPRQGGRAAAILLVIGLLLWLLGRVVG